MKKFNIYNLTTNKIMFFKRKIAMVLKKAIKEEKVDNIYFNVIIVDNNYIHNLNKEYRKIDKETDVITFALEDSEDIIESKTRLLGDIYISYDKALEQSKEYEHSLTRELCFLSVHGFLHLLGYDHMNKKDEEKMFNKQDIILEKISRR